MLGCMIGDYLRNPKYSSEGITVMMAVADVLLSKLVFEDLRQESESDTLYRNRFDYFITHAKRTKKEIQLNQWTQIAAIPIGFSANTIDEAKEEAKRCTRIMTDNKRKQKEAMLLASLIFLGKEGVPKEAIPFFLEAEYKIKLNSKTSPLSRAILDLIGKESFEIFIEQNTKAKRKAYTLLCGGLGQAFFSLPEHLTHATLDALDEDYKRILLSFHKTYDLIF